MTQIPADGSIPPAQPPTIKPRSNSNPLGVAGFVMALLGLLMVLIPILNWILCVLGVIFSFVGVFRKPRGFAIAGLVLSFINLGALVFALAAIVVMATMGG